MKKLSWKILLTCLFALIVAFCGCGTYTPAQNSSGGGSTSSSGGFVPEVKPEDENLFTVHLVYEGKQYLPSETIGMEAFWTDGFQHHRASFEEDGVARIDGLDGDYRLTLSTVPEGFAYDPSAYVATNDDKHIVVELFKITKTVGKGSGLYSCIALNKTGVYEAEITSEKHIVYYQFSPRTNGTYSVESWVDVTENMVNPKLDIYTGSFAAKYYQYTMDEGGVCSTYTKNCKYLVNITDDEVGGSFTFGLKAEVKSSYPQKVWFAVKRDGGFDREDRQSRFVVPTEDFSGKRELYGDHEYDPSRYQLTTPEINKSGAWQYDGSMFGLNEEDGWYHLKNEATGKFDGPILYAYITLPCQFFETPFSTIEYAGNKALTLPPKKNKNGEEESKFSDNYKLFIEGKAASSNVAFCVNAPLNQEYCPCHPPYTGGFCLEGCVTCHAQCTTLPQGIYDAMTSGDGGYADWTNSDGLYPVTAELKEFLYRYSTSQLLFMDGGGWCEGPDNLSGKEVDSTEADQWLFACAYYKPI